ncbi:unnamed protein product [Hermetia illucens]|uniref:Uncharacterized protein n=1 Tax=Hermetia illucens TaxID=343691 RepID=A0A7R8UML4_HERIL|nr:unnamed protein product [Hermetia illucens]
MKIKHLNTSKTIKSPDNERLNMSENVKQWYPADRWNRKDNQDETIEDLNEFFTVSALCVALKDFPTETRLDTVLIVLNKTKGKLTKSAE